MTPDEIAAAFTWDEGQFRFARWRRPLVPVVFGVDDATLVRFKAALTAAAALARHPMAETDPEQGANLMIFVARDWAEVAGLPDLDGLVPGLRGQIEGLAARRATQFIHTRFEADGALRALIVFVVLAGAMAEVAAEDLARALALRAMLHWRSDRLAPAAARALLAAAYDPVLPDAATDPALALRLAARVAAAGSP